MCHATVRSATAAQGRQTDEITLKLPTGETLKITRDDARVLTERLWEIAPHPGAAPIAVKISDAVSAPALLRKSVDVSEREYGALHRVLADQPSP